MSSMNHLVKENYNIIIGRASLVGIKGEEPWLISFYWPADPADKWGTRPKYYGIALQNKHGQVEVARPSPRWASLLNDGVMYGWSSKTWNISISTIIDSYDYATISQQTVRDLQEVLQDVETIPDRSRSIVQSTSVSPSWIKDATTKNIQQRIQIKTSQSNVFFFLAAVFLYFSYWKLVAVLVLFGILVYNTKTTIVRFEHDGNFVPWIAIKTSTIAGNGLFASVLFEEGQPITKYLGHETSNKETMEKWCTSSIKKEYICELGGKKTRWIVPSGKKELDHLLFAHYMNHSDAPNCTIDKDTGVVYARYQIEKGEELTFDYGSENSKKY